MYKRSRRADGEPMSTSSGTSDLPKPRCSPAPLLYGEFVDSGAAYVLGAAKSMQM